MTSTQSRRDADKSLKSMIVKSWINFFSTSVGNTKVADHTLSNFKHGFIVMVNQRGRQDEPIRVLDIQEDLLETGIPKFEDTLFPVIKADAQSEQPKETWIHDKNHINARRWEVNDMVINALKSNIDLFTDTRIKIISE